MFWGKVQWESMGTILIGPCPYAVFLQTRKYILNGTFPNSVFHLVSYDVVISLIMSIYDGYHLPTYAKVDEISIIELYYYLSFCSMKYMNFGT